MAIDRRIFKTTSPYLVYKKLVKRDFNQFEKLINDTSRNLKLRQNEFKEEWGDLTCDESIDQFLEEYSEEVEVFEKFVFNNLILSIYGSFEYHLTQICSIKSNGFKFTVNQLKGDSYLDKCKIYFKKIRILNLEDLNQEWREINNIRKIRNIIVHENSSYLKGESQQEYKGVESYLKDKDGISWNQNSGLFYIKSEKYLYDSVNLFKKYLIQVIDRLSISQRIHLNSNIHTSSVREYENEAIELLKMVIKGNTILDQSSSVIPDNTHNELTILLNNMGISLTKLCAMFLDGKWKETDSKMILNEGIKGLEKLLNIYGRKN